MRKWLVLAHVVAAFASAVSGAIPQSERDALVALYNATGGQSWAHGDNWLGPPGSEGTWYGVGLTEDGGNVQVILLWGNGLAGEIPPEIGAFPALAALELNGNALAGTIPSGIANLTQLSRLVLSDNFFQGEIPEWLGTLSLLQRLDLGGNALTGGIPASLGALRKLRHLSLNSNRLEGTLPPQLGELVELVDLLLWGNSLTGQIPDGWSSMTRLEQVGLGYNTLTGPIPSWLGGLAGLRSLDLGFNRLTGGIPAGLGECRSLERLVLSENPLGGEIPPSLGSLAKLRDLVLFNDGLTGTIPAEIPQLPSLVNLVLGRNGLSGPLPESWANMANMLGIDLSDNRFTGTIPPAWGGLASVEWLTVGANQLEGAIPPGFADLKFLEFLEASNNRLSGELPGFVPDLPALRYLWLSGNRFSGAVPKAWGNCPVLESLLLSSNLLDGPIPPELGEILSLRELHLAVNQFSGTIPTSLGDLVELRSLDLAGNQLSGAIPSQLASLLYLEYLSLSWNRLSGPFPAWLSGLVNLRYVSVEYNLLEGPLPQDIGNLRSLSEFLANQNLLGGPLPESIGTLVGLTRLELYGNRFSGEIPSTLMDLTCLAPGGLDIRWNSLWTSNADLAAFVNSHRQQGEEFELTQTVTPGSVSLAQAAYNTVKITWKPIPYTSDEGGYEVLSSDSPEGPYTLRYSTSDRNAGTYTGCLCSGAPQYYVVRSFTLPNGMNQSRLTSPDSEPLLASPGGSPTGAVKVHYNAAQHGRVFKNSPSQILPATYLTFELGQGSFPAFDPHDPVLIRVALPYGAKLSQTLATGGPYTASPVPANGETVFDLAVWEYEATTAGGVYAVRKAGAMDGIGPHAVQMFRYVEGEGEIGIRVTESTSNWPQPRAGRFFGFTVGMGEGVWPPDGNSNWGADGALAQPSTMFYCDLRGYAFDPVTGSFPVSLCSWTQNSVQGAGTAFDPCGPALFSLDAGDVDQTVSSMVCRQVQGVVMADVDGDGLEDAVCLDETNHGLYWSYGRPDGSYQDTRTLQLTGITPVTLNVDDVTGDGKPDVLVTDASGVLHVYDWNQVFPAWSTFWKSPEPSLSVAMAGLASSSLVGDVNRDDLKEFLYSDKGGNTMNVLSGPGLGDLSSYGTGAGPVAMAFGDFTGSRYMDVAVANAAEGSVTLFINDGAGAFTPRQVPGAGSEPVAVDAADFNRDGLSDLALALRGDKALAIWKARAGGQFALADRQVIPFLYTPSAVQAENFDGQNGPDALVGYSDYYKLALCTSDAAGSLTHSYNIDTRGDVQFDPLGGGAQLQSDRVLSVAAGTSLGGISSRQGVAAIQDKGVGVLHLPRSEHLSFALVNAGDKSVLLTMELYQDASGMPAGASSITIPAQSQVARYVDEVLGEPARDDHKWARAMAASPGVAGMWLANDPSAWGDFDGAEVLDVRDAQTDLVFPVIYAGEGETTSLILINPLKEQAKAVLTLHGAAGAVKGVASLSIGGRNRRSVSPPELFPSVSGGDFVRVTSDRGLLGTEMFGGAKTLACLNALPASSGLAGAWYSPHVAFGDFGIQYESVLTLVNASSQGANVAVSLVGDDGVSLSSKAVAIPSNGKLDGDVAEFFGLAGTTFSGYLRVDTGGATGVTGCVTFGEAKDGRFISCLPLQQAGHSRYLLGHIANGVISGVSFYTGIAILNPESDPGMDVSVQVTAYGPSGIQLDSRALKLGGRERSVFLLDQLMPRLTSIAGGFIVVESRSNTSGVLVFELFGDYDLQFLSAVPAIPLEP